MSADKLPIHHPRTTSNASQAPSLIMATTQLPPLAPHVTSQYFPSPSVSSQTWFPSSVSAPFPPTPPTWRPGPSFYQPPLQHAVSSLPQMASNRPLQPRRRPPVMSVQSLLQSEPSSPPQSTTSTKSSNRASPRSIPSPHTFHTRLSLQSPRHLPPSREPTDQLHRPSLLGESSFSAGSPIENYPTIHRGSESSQHSSLTSSSSFAPYRSTQPQPLVATSELDPQGNQ